MFSTEEDLIRRTGKNGVPRKDFLQELVDEFQATDSEEAKEQVLANLANFAYDPINYKFFRELKVIDLFLDQITEGTETLSHFSLAGLCNLCLDPENKEYILNCGGVRLVASCLSTRNVEALMNAITTLQFLITPESKAEITCPEIVDCMVRLSRSHNPRIKNLAVIFLEDYCSDSKAHQTAYPSNSSLSTMERFMESKKQIQILQSEELLEIIEGEIQNVRAVDFLTIVGLAKSRLFCSGKINGENNVFPPIYVGAKVVVTQTISKDKVESFAKATDDWNPVHFDSEEHAMKQSTALNSQKIKSKAAQGNAAIVHGALLNGIVSGVIGTKLPGPGTLLVSQTLNYVAALPVGSQVEVEVEVIGCKRREVNVMYKVVSCVDGLVVMNGQARLMVPKGRITRLG
ncbi:hypothetical protein J437_LFUL006552 [Ladona fulva]|uniref:Armadillo repeat-containing protein 7 n=1 Tax=Ladona fulva TaxID=123851 RepID=A0A8K0P774_LADFU|nr:hypothetical protein J437_LFUL006552 [Ladona fulva]